MLTTTMVVLTSITIRRIRAIYLFLVKLYRISIKFWNPIRVYGVTITDKSMCEYFQEIEVPASELSCITAYSAFSPNGDQNNDYWHIDNIELYPDALVEVFNRWGDRVYSTKKYINSWEGAWQGLYKNNPLPSATYYYVITLNNEDETLTGTVTIVR